MWRECNFINDVIFLPSELLDQAWLPHGVVAACFDLMESTQFDVVSGHAGDFELNDVHYDFWVLPDGALACRASDGGPVAYWTCEIFER
jgi:hypothetical protein